MLLIVWSRQSNWWRIWARRLPSWRTWKRWPGPVSLTFYLRIAYSSNESLASVRGTLLEAKCFGNILEFKDARNVPDLSTEIIFQMAILGALRLRWIPTNSTYISTVDKDHRIQRHMSREEAVRFFLEKTTDQDPFQRQLSTNLVGKLAAYGMSLQKSDFLYFLMLV